MYRTTHCLVAVLAVLVALPGMAFAQTVVTGRIVDAQTDAPIPRATVLAEGTYTGTAAGDDGRFVLRVSEATALRFDALGYAPKTLRLSSDDLAADTTRLTVQLAPRNVPLGHVTVTAERAPAYASPSRYVISPASAKQIPALGEPDVVRAAARIPGIAQPNDLDTRLNVRGGAADQNQYLLNGVELYNPTHLFGLFGAFNAYALEEVNVHAADVPARYGGRLSSVIDVTTRVPDDSTYAQANVSLVSMSGAYAKQHGASGVMIAARRTYADPVLAATGSSARYQFLDVHLDATHDLTETVRLRGMGFWQRDVLSARGGLDDDAFTSEVPDASTRWGNAMAALRVKTTAGGLDQQVTGSYVRSFTRATETDISHRGAIDDLTVQYEGAARGERTRLRWGGSSRWRTFDTVWSGDDALETVFYDGVASSFDDRKRQHLVGLYLTAERLAAGGRLVATGSLRYDHNVSAEQGEIQPRLRATLQASEDVGLHASAGRYAQFVATGAEGSEFNVNEPLLPLDRPQTAWTYTAGTTVDLSDTYRLRATGYARFFDAFARVDAEASSALGGGTPSADSNGVFRYGTARAAGIDVLLEKSSGWITGQLAYAFARVRTTFDDTAPPSWDLPHSLRGAIGLKAGAWTLHLAGHVRSGLPYTPYVGRILGASELPDGFGWRFVPGERNAERLPAYARFDVALRRTYSARWFDWELYVQALNVLNRRNALRVDPSDLYRSGVSTTGEQGGVERSLPIVPSVGVELMF